MTDALDPYYLMGDDDYDDEVELLGASLLGEADPILGQRAAIHRRITAARGGMAPRQRVRRALVPRTPGVPKPGAREMVLGFQPVQFTDSSALVLATLPSNPQVPFKPRRLIVEATRSAAGIGGALTITQILIGNRSAFVNSNPVPLIAFSPTSTGVDMALDPGVPGTEFVITVAAAVQPTTAATVDITFCMFGLSIA